MTDQQRLKVTVPGKFVALSDDDDPETVVRTWRCPSFDTDSEEYSAVMEFIEENGLVLAEQEVTDDDTMDTGKSEQSMYLSPDLRDVWLSRDGVTPAYRHGSVVPDGAQLYLFDLQPNGCSYYAAGDQDILILIWHSAVSGFESYKRQVDEFISRHGNFLVADYRTRSAPNGTGEVIASTLISSQTKLSEAELAVRQAQLHDPLRKAAERSGRKWVEHTLTGGAG